MRLKFILYALFFMLLLAPGCSYLDITQSENSYPLNERGKSERGEAVADQLVQMGKADAAIPIYQKLLTSLTEFDRGPLLIKLAEAQYQNSEYEVAIQSYLAATETFSDICTVDTGIARSLFAMGQVSLAVIKYQDCLKIDPEHQIAREGWALSAVVKDGDLEALAYLKQLAVADPSNIQRQNNYALGLILTNNLIKSRQQLEKYAYSVDEAYVVRQNLALVLALMGDEAAARYVALLDLPPDQVASNLAYYRRLREGGNVADLKSVLIGAAFIK